LLLKRPEAFLGFLEISKIVAGDGTLGLWEEERGGRREGRREGERVD
jgi:hypothetical protein